MGTHVLTGANGGIGAATAYELKDRDQSVVAVTRKDADLSLMHEVNRLADGLLQKLDALDGLLLNAGMASSGTNLTSEKFEHTFAVNHLGAFLLAHRLLPLLQRSPQGRIVLTGSSDHMAVKEVSVPDIASTTTPSYTRAYANSKAVAMAGMFEMARRLTPAEYDENADQEDQPDFVRVNVADPAGPKPDSPVTLRYQFGCSSCLGVHCKIAANTPQKSWPISPQKHRIPVATPASRAISPPVCCCAIHRSTSRSTTIQSACWSMPASPRNAISYPRRNRPVLPGAATVAPDLASQRELSGVIATGVGPRFMRGFDPA